MSIKKYYKIWLKMTFVAAQTALASRFGAVVFTVAKLLRFGFFLFFLFLLESQTKIIAGYSLWEVILFFITFNIIDTSSQLLLRETYRFREYVVKGFFDYILIKPFSPLFRSLFGGSDILDLPLLIMLFIFLGFTLTQIDGVTIFGIIVYFSLLLNAFIIALSFHIFVLGLGILTTEIDNSIMLYRDLTQMGRVPVDIYHEPLRGLLTFAIPVGIMMTFPAKALLGVLSLPFIFIAIFVSLTLLILSILFWKYALNKYASASS